MPEGGKIMTMLHHKKVSKLIKILAIPAFLLFSVPAFANSTDTTDYKEGVISGSNIYFDRSSSLAIWEWGQYICSGLLQNDYSIIEPCIEGAMTDEIRYMAACDGYIYVATERDVRRIPAQAFTGNGGILSTDIVYDDDLVYGFEIYDGYMYMLTQSQVKRVPLSGGTPQSLASGVYDFELTNRGIIYTLDGGGLMYAEHDGSNSRMLLETPDFTKFLVNGSLLMYRDNDNRMFELCFLQDGYSLDVRPYHTPEDLGDFYFVWPYLFYEAEDDKIYRLNMESDEEVPVNFTVLWSREDRTILDNRVLYYRSGDSIRIRDLKNIYAEYNYDADIDLIEIFGAK